MSSIMLSFILAMLFELLLLRKMSEMFCHFLLLYQNNATMSPEVPVIPISGIYLVLLMSHQANIFHINFCEHYLFMKN